MDVIVSWVDSNILSPVIFNPLSGLLVLPDFITCTPNCLFRQILALYLIVILGGAALYLFTASLSYVLFFYLFRSKYHPIGEPQPFPGQEWLEIRMALRSIPTMAHLTIPFLLGEVRGYSRLYDSVDEFGGWPYLVASILAFVLFSDSLIYWIHRGLHESRWLYANVHKEHHKWKVPTPYAGIAFHPVDGWAQSLPYHIFPYLFPMHKWASLLAFVGVQIWAVLIHDGVHWTPLRFVNGSAHHTYHHSKFYYNYGQFFTFWDRWAGTHMDPFEDVGGGREKEKGYEKEKERGTGNQNAKIE